MHYTVQCVGRSWPRTLVALACLFSIQFATSDCVLGEDRGGASDSKAATDLVMIVMDPLAGPLSCPCVEGYAQRKYEVLAKHLESRLKRKVRLEFADALSLARKATKGRVDLIVGKDSVVRADAAAAKIQLRALAQLTDLQGEVTQRGLIVVNKDDPAQSAADLKGYSIIFGPVEAEEKHAAAIALLESAKVKITKPLVIDQACSDGACKVVDLGAGSKTAAVISSYARPLLEGCGTVAKGDLRVVGKTHDVPFISAFVNRSLTKDEQDAIAAALLSVGEHPALLAALESAIGFLPYPDGQPTSAIDRPAADQPIAGQNSSWPGWRGPRRNGHVDWLPATLDERPSVVWDIPLIISGLGGIAANDRYVFFGDRDLDDLHDVYRCLDADTGLLVWEVMQLAVGELDYGNSPRATPLIYDGSVIFLGAMGDLVSIDIKSGKTRWQLNLVSEFGATTKLPWGYCGSPLVVDGKLIVNPGADDASLVALDPDDGTLLWKTPGRPAAYGSFIAGVFGGVHQIVGYDATTLGGWDVDSGKRLWTVKPKFGGEFNVPTPLQIGEQLLVSTEQNGTRRFAFTDAGKIDPVAIDNNTRLKPDMSSPVIVGDNLYCVNNFLYCLDLRDQLNERWRRRDRSLSDYASIIASPERLLVVGDGELLMLGTDGTDKPLARQRVFDEPVPLYSAPALVGNRLYIRGESRMRCIAL